MRFGSLLVVTYGRSGSTLLQGILNTIPQVLLRGENNNFAFGLFTSYRNLFLGKEHEYAKLAHDATHPWYGVLEIDLEEFKSLCREMIYKTIVPSRLRNAKLCYGFKEIRYPFIVDDMNEYLRFLTNVMPEVAIIFLFRRRKSSLLRSAWWRDQDQGQVIELIGRFEDEAVRYFEQHPDHSFVITYEEIIEENSQKLKELFSFLEAEYDAQKICETLEKTHSTRTSLSIASPGSPQQVR